MILWMRVSLVETLMVLLINAEHVKYWHAPSVTSDGSKAGSSYNSVPSQANYAHPYYWAPFILMGNWN